MTNSQSNDDGSLSDDELEWLVMRARGGFGVVETCAAHVSLDGQGWAGELGVFDDRLVPGLRRLASSLTEHGAVGIAQIFHGGLRAPQSLTNHVPWSATAFEAPKADIPRPATDEDITRVIGDFARAAARCCEAGFSGVELHGAHGYLLGQFLSRTINTRDDRWGGTLEGRARLVREAMRAVRAAVPDRFVVGIRLSPEDRGNAVGLDLDESLEVARWVSEDGADYVHLSLWNASKNTKKRPDQHPTPLFREVVPRDVALVVAGDIWTREDAQGALAQGASAVALGRAAIANPDWPAKIAEPGWVPRRPPLTIAELRARGLTEKFADYMRNWRGFVAE